MREIILMAFCSLLQNRRFCPTLETAVLSHFRNRRFCLIFEIGGFVPFPKSAILSHLKSALLSCPGKFLLKFTKTITRILKNPEKIKTGST